MKHLIAVGLLVLAGAGQAEEAGQVNAYVGLAMHDRTYDAVDWYSPLGVFGLEYRRGADVVYIEHTSSVQEGDDGNGINVVGYKRRWRLW